MEKKRRHELFEGDFFPSKKVNALNLTFFPRTIFTRHRIVGRNEKLE